jgi:hypothetical protein
VLQIQSWPLVVNADANNVVSHFEIFSYAMQQNFQHNELADLSNNTFL